ncbi:cell division protein FtsX [Sphingorhabdus lacus]|jgi:cell division transport system permease protein|uniref:Cell division protein n=1 Tax=Sphingorhabdus lacus TaxID=392610 RepID=A0A6I6LAT2_9SPHN|nr:cell division protein [Sphingorhabdus lacus]QGY81678.1 cell division protein [Sphingorhabdus lacus]
MLLDFALPAHDRKLIPEGRLSGPMPWVIAIMLFLTLLIAAMGLSLAYAIRNGGDDLALQATVQIIEPDPIERATQKVAVSRILRELPEIAAANSVPDVEVRNLLKPWLGNDVIDADIPVPALIDIRFKSVPDGAAVRALKRRLETIAPKIRIDSHSSWMAPFFDLMSSLILLTLAIFLLLLIATSAVVILAVRSTLNTHRGTIEIMHMMGGTDLQAARLFQRRVALDALLGGVVGFGAAATVILTLGGRIAAVEPALLAEASLPWYGWLILAIIPLAVMGLAMLMARWTVVSALKKML